MRIWGLYIVAFTLLGCDPALQPSFTQISQRLIADIPAQLDTAVTLFRRTRAESFLLAGDPGEQNETLIGPAFIRTQAQIGGWETIFTVGDEAFEAEYDRKGGVGQGLPPELRALPMPPLRIHQGERGGLDASSCRSCHFVGGPDGAGTATQHALFRGDGRYLSSATVREAPHVMGLGYIERIAREMEAELHAQRDRGIQLATALNEPQTVNLLVHNLSFGRLIAYPDGHLDTDEIRHISNDLRMRPFGHKGRHANLVELADEALQIHLGIQSTARMSHYAEDAVTYLGDGSAFDPDQDGAEFEALPAQSVLLASYMSMLGVPQIRPPSDPILAREWARGMAVFERIGCGVCHTPVHTIQDPIVTINALAPADWSIEIPLDRAGQNPRPQRIDFGPWGDNEQVRPGIPVHAFTDLRRHNMGPELAEEINEILSDGGGEVDGAEWLTRSLWGVADTAPYLHDGRALTVDQAIRWHGGEGEDARDAYIAARPAERAAVQLFLMSLTRAPMLLVE